MNKAMVSAASSRTTVYRQLRRVNKKEENTTREDRGKALTGCGRSKSAWYLSNRCSNPEISLLGRLAIFLQRFCKSLRTREDLFVHHHFHFCDGVGINDARQ
jgi:hypothetical protein